MKTQQTARWWTVSRVLALLLLAVAGLIFVVAPKSFALQCVAVAAILASVQLVRRSGPRAPKGFRQVGSHWRGVKLAGGPGRVAWILFVASVVAVGASRLLLNNDFVHGGHQVWPLYVFVGAIVALFIAMEYITVNIQR